MLCEKKSHPLRTVMLVGIAMLAVGGVAFCMGSSKKGRRLSRKARRLGREAENLIREEMGC